MIHITKPTLLEALASLPTDPLRPEPKVEAGGSRRQQAGVALILREGRSLDLLLIKRARSPRDPWSGHMAFPGGRLEPGDTDLRATAMRETHEETGLILEGASTYLGRLPTLAPSTRRIPAVAVSPHVFVAPGDARAEAASREVASTHWISLDTLRSSHVRGDVQIALPEGARAFPCFRVDGQVVWGLTYRILTDFLARL